MAGADKGYSNSELAMITSQDGQISRRTFLASLAALMVAPQLSAWVASDTIPVTAINHLAIEVPNPARSLEWYQNLFGLPISARQGNTPILRVGSGPQFMAISGGNNKRAGFNHLGLAVDNFNVNRIVGVLRKNGFSSSDKPGPMQFSVRKRGKELGDAPEGTPEVFFGDPDGIVVQLQDSTYCGGGGVLGNECRDTPEPAPSKGLLRIRDFSHFTTFITDMKRSVAFYRELFGFRIDTYQGATPMLRVGSGNQFLVFVDGFLPPTGPTIDHACFFVDDFDVDRLFKVLADYGVTPIGEAMRAKGPLQAYVTMRKPDRGGAPGGTAEFYFTDPDGIVIQLQDARYCGGSGYLGDECGTPENPRGHTAAGHGERSEGRRVLYPPIVTI